MINNTTYQNKLVLDRSQVGDVPLGNIASIVSAPDPSNYSTYTARIERFRLQSTARSLLPDERVSRCLRFIIPGLTAVGLMYSPSTRSGHYKNLQICGSVWMCPVCSSKITERRRLELEVAIKAPFYRVAMLSYTLQHSRDMPLETVLDALTNGYRALRQVRAFRGLMHHYGAVGSIRCLEVTHGEANGWHPHIHELLFVPAHITERQLLLLGSKLSRMWIAALERRGFTASKAFGFHLRAADDVAAAYVTTWGGAAAELAKMPMKRGRGVNLSPIQLLALAADGDYRAGVLWKEYAAAFKRRHQLQWSPGLRKLLALPEVEKTDEELATEVREDAFLLAWLPDPAWKIIRRLDLRAELLNVVSTGDEVLLLDWLAEHGIHLDDSTANLLDGPTAAQSQARSQWKARLDERSPASLP